VDDKFDAAMCKINVAKLEKIEADVSDLALIVKGDGNGNRGHSGRLYDVENYIQAQVELAKEKRDDNRKLKQMIAGAFIAQMVAILFLIIKAMM